MAKAKTQQASKNAVTKLNEFFLCVEVTGSALIQNCFSQKAVEEMLKKHMGFEVKREPKRVRDCLERAIIRNVEEVICLPPIGFKKGMLTAAATAGKSLKKTHLRQQIFVEGNSVPIQYEKMTPRMDIVRLAGINRTPDIRFRPMFENWRARFIISFSEALQSETIIDLLNRAGKVGVGEWRPEKDGTFGTYSLARCIDDEKEISEVKRICAPHLKPLIIPAWAMDAEVDASLAAKIAASQANHDEDEPNVESQEEGEVGPHLLDQDVDTLVARAPKSNGA